ncbi:MAG: NAD-dependent epimerase/dehydratase family protein [Paracoccaceae bacterium]
MKIALTGGCGGIGRAITEFALAEGHSVVSLDRVIRDGAVDGENLRFIEADVADYEALVEGFAGCDALIHMAAIPNPRGFADHDVHNNNVVGSYNAMRAAVENGISRICQASSVNAIGLSFSRAPRFDYFPLDEAHPNYSEEPYSLSKWICEAQADSFARRYEDISIASMRFHWVVPDRAAAGAMFNPQVGHETNHLWGYTRFDSAARACVQALTASFKGHEVFYILGPDTCNDIPTLELAARYCPQVPVKGDLGGNRSFFSSEKAERMLGWRHDL